MSNRLTTPVALIIPVYNEAKTLVRNLTQLHQVLSSDGVDYTLTLVDDGSRDNTWDRIGALSAEIPAVPIKAIRFSRNFGKETAIWAGLEQTDAERYIIMDSDLQHPPRYIKDMLAVQQKTGADIIECVKTNRGKETLKYKLLAKTFYRFMKLLSGVDLDNSSDFKLLTRPVVDALRQMGEGRVLFRGLVNWVGFHTERIPFAVDPRIGDNSKFSMLKLMKMSVDAVMSFTAAPLLFSVLSGILFLIFAAIMGIQTLINYFSGQAVSGFSTVILLILITGSILMISLGLIGAYIARIYDEIKARPRYIIRQICENGGKTKEDNEERP